MAVGFLGGCHPLLAAAPSHLSFDAVNLVENSSLGTIAGTFSAIDPDPDDLLTYSLVPGTGDTHHSLFEINDRSLILVASPDFEIHGPQLSVRVRVSDSNSEFFEKIFTLPLADVRTEDADADGLTEAVEEDVHGTSDLKFDSDDDGFGDAYEIARSFLPNNGTSHPQGSVVLGWGANASGQVTIPPSLSTALEIAAGTSHSLALLENGTVVAWGRNVEGQCNVPAGLSNVVAIGAGDNHSLAVLANGQLVGWGANALGQATPPPGLSNVVAVAAGGRHTIALKGDGQVTVWGADDFYQSTQPNNTNNVISISATRNQCMVVFADGRVRTWGQNDFSQSLQPLGLSLAIAGASGEKHSMMLRRGGDVISWGANSEGQLTPPSGLNNGVAIQSRGLHNLAIRADRTVVAWGSNSSGQSSVPFEARRAKRIAAGSNHSLVLRRNSGFPEFSSSSGLFARVGTPLTHALAIVNATATSFSSMPLPAGLVLNAQTGIISGTPLNEDRRAFVVFAHTSKGRLSQTILLSFGDENLPTDITISPSTVRENAAAGTVAATIQAIDPDVGSQHTFALVEGDGDLDNYRFEVSGNQLTVRYGIDVDFEAPHVPFQIRLQATDSAGGRIEVPLTIALLDDRTEDADGDGIAEGDEEDIHGTSDQEFDSDGDGIGDAAEVQAGTSPTNPALWPDTPFAAWGFNHTGGIQPPFTTGVVSLAQGQSHGLAIRQDGAVFAWGGKNSYGQRTTPPYIPGDIVSVAAGGNAWLEDAAQSLALHRDGSLVGWGYNFSQQASPPSQLTDVLEIAAGRDHGLALHQNGTVVAWGADDYGQCQVPEDLADVVSVSAGGFQSLALKKDGNVVAWGKYFDGSAWQPNLVPTGLTDVIAISAGRFHCLALRRNGTVVAWGDSSFDKIRVPSSLTNVIAIAAGGFHSLALKADGSVTGWGMNRYNQSTPPGPAQQNVRLIGAGLQHSIAIRQESNSPEISSSRNLSAAVGTAVHFPVTVLHATPVAFAATGLPPGFSIHPTTGVISGTFQAPYRGVLRVFADTSHGRLVQSISVSGNVGLAPTLINLAPWTITENTPEGTLVGSFSITDPDSNNDHRVELINGAGDQDNASFVAHQGHLFVSDRFFRDFEAQPAPISIRVRVTDAELNAIEQILTLDFLDDRTEDRDRDGLTEAEEEDTHLTSDLVADSDQDSFSDGFEAARATNPKSASSKPSGTMLVSWGKELAGNSTAPVNPGDLIDVRAGHSHSLGLRPDGTVIAWGSNNFGQLQVPNTLIPKIAISAGGRHSLVINSTGTVTAWGSNESGQCNVPATLADVIAIAAGEAHSLALRADGTVVAWGWSGYGQANVPEGLTDVIAIAAGGFHSLALKSDGTVVAWGYDSHGITEIPGNALQIIGIAAGGYHSLALRSDGTLVAWGSNLYGQCDVPKTLTAISQISAGWVHSMALRENGQVIAWGDAQVTALPMEATKARRIAAGYTHSLALRDDFPATRISDASRVLASEGQFVNHPISVIGSIATEFYTYGLPEGLQAATPTGLQAGVIQTGMLRSVLLQAKTNRGLLERILLYDTIAAGPRTAIKLSPASVMENSPAGNAIGSFSATLNGQIIACEFSLTSGPGDDHNSRFQINNGNLSLSSFLDLDYELSPDDISIRVLASNPSSGPPFEQNVFVKLTNDWSEQVNAHGGSEAAALLIQWAEDAGFTADDRLPQAIPRGDGLSNLVKYAFGLNPAVPLGDPAALSAGLPRFVMISQAEGGVFSFHRRKNTGVEYEVQVSSALAPGSSVPWAGVQQATSLDDDWEEVRCAVPPIPTSPSRQFFQVRVFLP